MECKSRMEFLSGILRENYQQLNTATFIEAVGKEPKIKSMDFELVFRGVLEDIISRTSVGEMIMDGSLVRKLLVFAFSLIKQGGTVNYARIPYLLFADLFEGHTIANAERLWSLLEFFTDGLTDVESFRTGKYIILRACNTLLRRLSKSCNPEFCGRVLMFLAAVYPISERSAVNHAGKINTSNLTSFESEIDFKATALSLKEMHENLQNVASSKEKNKGKKVDKEKTKKRGREMDVTDSGNAGVNEASVNGEQIRSTSSIVDYDSDGDKNEENTIIESSKTSDALIDENSPESVVLKEKYESYKMFWGLQSFMITENAKRFVEVPTVAAANSDAGVPPTPIHELQSKEWKGFTDHALAVLKAFDDAKYSEADREAMMMSSKEKKEKKEGKMTSVVDDFSAYFGCKYLTSSDLLVLQVRDPSFRLQLGAQILFYINYLRSHPIPCLKVPVSVPTPPVVIVPATKESRAGAGTKKEPIIPVGTDASSDKNQAEKFLDIENDLDMLENGCFDLIQKTPPDGPEFVLVLRKLLERETNWKKWQKGSCASFEKYPVVISKNENDGDKGTEKETEIKKKRPLSAGLDGVKNNGKSKKAKIVKVDYNSQSNVEIMESAKRLLEKMPTYEEHIQMYIDAEDPDNGIDAEYHPKNDSVYSWRARRLIASNHLYANESMLDGDISKGLSAIRGDDKIKGTNGAGTVLSGVGLMIEEVEKDQEVSLKIEEDNLEGTGGSGEEVIEGDSKEKEGTGEGTEEGIEGAEEKEMDGSLEIKSEVETIVSESEVVASTEVEVEDKVEVEVEVGKIIHEENVPQSESKEDSTASTELTDAVSS